jgi:hypothetical protein
MTEPTKEKMAEALQSVADCTVCGGCQDVAMGALKGQERVSVGEALNALYSVVSRATYPSTRADKDAAMVEARRVVAKATQMGMI